MKIQELKKHLSNAIKELENLEKDTDIQTPQVVIIDKKHDTIEIQIHTEKHTTPHSKELDGVYVTLLENVKEFHTIQKNSI